VGEHPHRGFETVTIVYEGVVSHRDSAGKACVIGPGDGQWMTAASGIVHEDMHERAWAKKGGTLHAIQLWVYLPKTHNGNIPTVELDGGAGRLRVIAVAFGGAKGPAKTLTPVHLYDVRLKAGHRAEITVPAGFNSAVFVLRGAVSVNGSSQCTRRIWRDLTRPASELPSTPGSRRPCSCSAVSGSRSRSPVTVRLS